MALPLICWDVGRLSRGEAGSREPWYSPPSDFYFSDNWQYIYPLVCAFFVALLPVWVVLARRSPSTREVLYSGWEPVIIAMAISR